MNALMAELAPYILAGLFGLVGWYLRDNARQHQALVDAVKGIPATIANLEQKLEDKIDTHARRFDKYALYHEARLTAVETRCAIEHGEMTDRRATAQKVVSWQERSDVGNHGTKAAT